MTTKALEVPRAHWEKICSRWQGGDTLTAIGRDHGVSPNRIKKILKELNAYDRIKAQPKRVVPRPGNGTDLKGFISAARSILWRQTKDGQHSEYDKWEKRRIALASDEGGGLANGQAAVRASKEFKCLHRLFREFDVSQYDTNPESHPEIQQWGKTSAAAKEDDVTFDGNELSYRENLHWAMEAAGQYLKDGKNPASAPNGSAWFFYRQAIDEPKDFMAKFGQMEAKASDASETSARKEARRTVAEIHEFLEALEGEENETNG